MAFGGSGWGPRIIGGRREHCSGGQGPSAMIGAVRRMIGGVRQILQRGMKEAAEEGGGGNGREKNFIVYYI